MYSKWLKVMQILKSQKELDKISKKYPIRFYGLMLVILVAVPGGSVIVVAYFGRKYSKIFKSFNIFKKLRR